MVSGVPFTVFRPSWFFESLPSFVVNGTAAVIGNQYLPRRWLAAADYARQVSNGLRTDAAANKCFYCLGPEPISISEAVTTFAGACRPAAEVKTMSIAEARTATNDPAVNRSIDFYEYMEGMDEDVDCSEADRLLGRNTTTLARWMGTYLAGRG